MILFLICYRGAISTGSQALATDAIARKAERPVDVVSPSGAVMLVLVHVAMSAKVSLGPGE